MKKFIIPAVIIVILIGDKIVTLATITVLAVIGLTKLCGKFDKAGF